MTELATLLSLADEAPDQRLALATVVNVSGSAYRRPGARMLITRDGRSAGTISGGCLEGDTRERAAEVIDSGHSCLVTYDSTASEDIIFGLGLGCNGIVQVLIEPLSRHDPAGMLAFLQACHRESKAASVATIYALRPPREPACQACPKPCHDCDSLIHQFKEQQRILHWPDGSVTSNILRPMLRSQLEQCLAEPSRQRIRNGVIVFPATDEAHWLIEALQPAPALHIFGAGDDAIPVADFASRLGWQVSITDARPAFANRQRFQHTNHVQAQRPECFDASALRDQVAVVMTHSYEQDKSWLRLLLPAGLRLISQIGPKARTRRLIEELRAEGLELTPEQLSSLQFPAGLDLGAETPTEVALSIISGIQAKLTRHAGGFLSERDGPIHQLPQR